MNMHNFNMSQTDTILFIKFKLIYKYIQNLIELDINFTIKKVILFILIKEYAINIRFYISLLRKKNFIQKDLILLNDDL